VYVHVCIYGCSDLGLRGPEHFIFAQLLNMASYVGKKTLLTRDDYLLSEENNVYI